MGTFVALILNSFLLRNQNKKLFCLFVLRIFYSIFKEKIKS